MDLRPYILPDDPSIRAAARAKWDAREDLRAAYPDPDSDGFARWLAVNGPLEYPAEFAEAWPPVPPRALRQTGCGGGEAHGHLWTGIEDFEVVAETYETFAQRSIHDLDAVLDFGSGCGRLLRWFDRAAPNTRLVGTDVRRASVEWCQANLRGEFHVGPFDPPGSLDDDSFDLVVGLSLFSHFTLEANLAWLRELTRVCRPDGTLILTTHGAFSLAVIAGSPEHQRAFRMSEADARGVLRNLQRTHFHYHEPGAEWRAAIEVGENYGQSFLDPGFVAEHWEAHVDVLGCVPARLFRFQDVWVLRPRG